MTPTTDHRTLFTPSSLSEHISLTPEGYLLCRNVPIARTGTQDYLASDFNDQLQGDPSGKIVVERTDDEVFRDSALDSFEGKPVTIGHPSEFVNPRNWKQYTGGFTRNIRRGTGDEVGMVLSDILLTDEAAIGLVQGGLREISCGYDADYEQSEPGRARQSNIYGNHVALVARGRAGPTHSIRDEETTMSVLDRLKAKFKAKTDDELETKLSGVSVEDDDDSNNTGAAPVTAATTDANADAEKEQMRAEIAELKAQRTADAEAAAKTKREAAESAEAERVAGQNTADAKTHIPKAEILVPGIAVNDGEDSAAFKRRVLKTAHTGDAKDSVEPFVAGQAIDDMAAAEVTAAFAGAAELQRQRNNTSGARTGITTKDAAQVDTPASINETNRAFWAKGA